MPYEGTQARRIAEGKCKDCGADRGLDGTKVACRPCANKDSARASARRAAKRTAWTSAGPRTCNTCGVQMRNEQFKTCEKCRAGARNYYHGGEARPRKRPTPEQTKAQNRAVKVRQRAKIGTGVCTLCSRPTTHASNYCQNHWLYNSLRRYGFTSAAAREVMWAKLEAQGFQCYYTGVDLTPGVNCSIDHRVPRSRGGDPLDPDNCVWCDRLINAFKNDLTEVEFVERCRRVVEIRG